MNRFEEHPELYEMISGYVDGTLSQRQETELRRLMANDPSISQEVSSMQRQKELLGSLPFETAPESLLNDIRASIERKVLLSEIETSDGGGKRHLFVRKFTTVAAMLVLAGMLGLVVHNIIAPEPAGNVMLTQSDAMPEQEIETLALEQENIRTQTIAAPEPMMVRAKAARAMSQYSATLRLETTNPIAMNAYVEKSIQSNGLVDCTIPYRRPMENINTYVISCDAGSLVSLMEDLGAVWPRFVDTSMVVHGETADRMYRINSVDPEVITEMLLNWHGQEPVAFTRSYDRNRELAGQLPGGEMVAAALEAGADSQPPIPAKPFLAWPSAEKKAAVRGGQEMKLTITIAGL